MPTQVTQGSSKHLIDIKGVAGFSFWLTMLGLVAYAIGFSGSSWHVYSDVHTGVWERCHCGTIESNSDTLTIQAMATIGLICVSLGLLLGLIYVFIHAANKTLILILFMSALMAAVLFMVVAIVFFGKDYGPRPGRLGYSFGMACAGLCCVGVAAVLALFQLTKSTCKC